MKLHIKKIIGCIIPYYNSWKKFVASTILPNSYVDYVKFRLGISKIYWPKDKTCLVTHPRKIYVGINSKIGRPGSYISGAGGVWIGDYVRFGPNVGIVSSNHDLYYRDKYHYASIKIGDYCWIGMNSLVFAGVELGPSTIVGGGSVVTKSFPDGYCVIAGNPAKVIKKLDQDKVVMPNHPEYYGYIPKEQWETAKSKYIDLSVFEKQ